MTSTALTVSILSEDSDLLREASWWLSAFGYKVHAVRDAKLLSTVWDGWQTDFLIVDAEHSAVETAAHLPQESHEHFTYRILLRRLDAPAYATHELEYVFNDALCRPLNYGEMLARLRAGARFNELDPTECIVVYCRSGSRSASVVRFLAGQGFGNVLNLEGGILAWRKDVDPSLRAY